MNTKTSILMAKARQPLGCGVRKFGILLTVMVAAIIALPNTVTNDVVVATSDAELRISDRGLGLGLEVVGGGAAEVKLETRPGWRFRDGSLSVTLNKAAGEPAKSPAIEGEGNGAENYVPGVDVNDDESGDDENDEGSVDHEKPVLSLTATAPKVVAYSVLDGGTNVSISLSATVTTKGKHRKLDANGNVVKEEEFSPKRYVWEMTGVATGEAETDSASHTFTVNLTKGKGKKLDFSVVGKICSICDGDVESDEATDSVEIDVYELSIDLPKEFLGLDLRDASKGEYVTCGASVKIEPEPPSVTYNWMDCGQCTFIGDTDKQDVVYGATGSNEGSSHYRAEPLTASVTIEGMDAAETCSTNFTVVKVDVVLSGVGEEGDETALPSVIYVSDDEQGGLSKAGLRSLFPVSVACKPSDVPGVVNVAIDVGTELYEITESLDGKPVHVSPKKASYPCSEIGSICFGIHGHSPVEEESGRKVRLAAGHSLSEAFDRAHVKVVPPPPLEILSVQLDSPADGGAWPYDPVWDDPEWRPTVDGSLAEQCAEDADVATVKYALNRDAKKVIVSIYEVELGSDTKIYEDATAPTSENGECNWEMSAQREVGNYYASIKADEKEIDRRPTEKESNLGYLQRGTFFVSTASDGMVGTPYVITKGEFNSLNQLLAAGSTIVGLLSYWFAPAVSVALSVIGYDQGLPSWYYPSTIVYTLSWHHSRCMWQNGKYTEPYAYYPETWEVGYVEVKYAENDHEWGREKRFYTKASGTAMSMGPKWPWDKKYILGLSRPYMVPLDKVNKPRPAESIEKED